MSDIEVIPAGISPACKYKPQACEAILEIASKGGHISTMMNAVGIRSKSTWASWKQRYPEFKEAVEHAEIISQSFYEQLGLQGIMGTIPNFNATTYALVMNNKFSNEYKRNPSGSGPTEITFNTVNMSSDQVSEKIAQKIERLKSLGVVLNVGQDE